jgi:protoporphyrinogen oxidase
MGSIVILGGGLTGLSTAWHLKQAGYDIYQLFEKESRVGGLTRSESVDGFTFDYTGHLLHFKDENIKETVLGLLGENIGFIERNSWIFSKNVFTKYPFQTNTYGLPKEIVKECIIGFIEAKYEEKEKGSVNSNKFSDESQEEKTFEDWIYESFGSGIAKHFMIPYNEKLWTVHPNEMTCDWMGRFVPQTSLDQLLDGALSDQAKKIGYNANFYYPLKGGIESLPKAFASSLSNLHINREAYKIDIKEKKITFKTGEEIRYDKLVSTLPLNILANSIHPLPNDIKNSISNLRYNSVFNINIGVDRNLSDKHWVYFPEPEYSFYRVGFSSNFSPYMAPKGTSSLYIEISYSDHVKPLDKTRAVEKVKQDLIKSRILNETDQILAEKYFDIKCAYVIYDKNRSKIVNQIKNFLNQNEIYTIGRYGSWEYSGMEDAIIQGKNIAAEIVYADKEEYVLKKPDRIPDISIVIPVYNEEKILESAVRDIIAEADKIDTDYELIICENGSKDNTLLIAQELSKVFPQVRAIHCPEPNYGAALELGILKSVGKNIVCFEIDYWDGLFIEIAKVLLRKYDAVVGSKAAKGARDRRPLIRRIITHSFNLFLKIVFGFQGTDTHGIKAFRREKSIDIVNDCKTSKDIFATELILRMERAGFYMCEIPLEIEEKRPPSINLFNRVPSTIKNLFTLWFATRNLKTTDIKKLESAPKVLE